MGPEILALLPALTMNEVRKRPQYEWAESHFILQNDVGGVLLSMPTTSC